MGMKNALITIVLTGLFSGIVFAEGGMGMGAGKGSGGMGMGAGKSSGDMGMEAGQSREQMRATQEQRFQNIDSDQDGYVTRKEAKNHHRLTNNWGKADTNSDNKLDVSEFSAFEKTVPPPPRPNY